MRSGRNLRLLFYDSCDIQNEKSKAGSNGRERDGGGGAGKERNYVVHVYTHNDKNRRQVFTGILQEIYVYTYIEEKREV